MRLKISTDEFLGVSELKKLQESLDGKGWRQYLLNNVETFGLVKKDSSLQFTNGLVEVGSLSGTFKVNNAIAVDSLGRYVINSLQDKLTIPTVGDYYWVKLSYKTSNKEVGTVSISSDGQLVGVNTLFTSILRGQPNFPHKIRFTSSSLGNTAEYSVNKVISDTTAILVGDFTAETNLTYEVVGCFTPGYNPASLDKGVYEYDSCLPFTIGFGLQLETSVNTPPTYTVGQDFYLARIKKDGAGTVTIEDKRIDFLSHKEDFELGRTPVENPLMGVESIKYNDRLSTKERNVVYVGWGFRSSNFTVNSTLNTITINAGQGGIFK